MRVTVFYGLFLFTGYKWQKFKPIVLCFRNRYFIILGLYSLSNPEGSVRYDLERYVKVQIHISKLSVRLVYLLLVFILVSINLCIVLLYFFDN